MCSQKVFFLFFFQLIEIRLWGKKVLWRAQNTSLNNVNYNKTTKKKKKKKCKQVRHLENVQRYK